MPVVIFFVCLDLEPDNVDFEILVNQQTHNMPEDFWLNIGSFSVHLKKKEFFTLHSQPDIESLQNPDCMVQSDIGRQNV